MYLFCTLFYMDMSSLCTTVYLDMYLLCTVFTKILTCNVQLYNWICTCYIQLFTWICTCYVQLGEMLEEMGLNYTHTFEVEVVLYYFSWNSGINQSIKHKETTGPSQVSCSEGRKASHNNY